MRQPVTAPLRVLIVDDSSTMRRLIKNRLARDARISVAGEASCSEEARRLIKILNPDVLTLDVEMPGMNGIDFLRKIMTLRPMPVVMVSSQTRDGSAAALEALSIGAVDCVEKPVQGQTDVAFENLPEVLIGASKARLKPVTIYRKSCAAEEFVWNGRHVLIGSSTGGVAALEILLGGYPENCPPTLISQHMPALFLSSFVKRLQQRIAPRIELAEEGAPLRQGMVYLAPGGASHLELDSNGAFSCRLNYSDKVKGYRPSVDSLFRSALPVSSLTIAVLLTGMGRDGADAMLQLRRNGALCIAQDEATCAVYGMPKAAVENGGACYSLPIHDICHDVLVDSSENALRQ